MERLMRIQWQTVNIYGDIDDQGWTDAKSIAEMRYIKPGCRIVSINGHDAGDLLGEALELLESALPHIECVNYSQSGIITKIGELLEKVKGGE